MLVGSGLDIVCESDQGIHILIANAHKSGDDMVLVSSRPDRIRSIREAEWHLVVNSNLLNGYFNIFISQECEPCQISLVESPNRLCG